MKQGAKHRPVEREGRLIAALLVLFVLACFVQVFERRPQPVMLQPVHAAREQALRRAEKVDLNAADEKELESLPGIGGELARRIVQYRQAEGLFRAPEDLLNVPGVGEGKLEALEDLIFIE